MNSNIIKLSKIAQKEERNIIGLMSGTSLDGLDVAYCKITGEGIYSKVKLVHFETIPYDTETKNEIRKVFAKKMIDFQQLTLLNEWIGVLHGNMVNQCLNQWNLSSNDVDLIASHGQTVLHAPKSLHQQEKFPNATLQIGDGDHIAVLTQCITVSDFRQKHLALGGEGAPLAVYGDYFLFSTDSENRILLNIGGISNFTFLPKSGDFQDVFVSDTGTGNTLMDAYTRLHFPDLAYDVDSKIAQSGSVSSDLLCSLKDHDFFKAPFPKSTGPELFSMEYLNRSMQESNTTTLGVADVLATLTRFTAETIAEAIIEISATKSCTPNNLSIYVSGGGIHNPLLMANFGQLLDFSIQSTLDLGIDGDAKEAILFALLANETVAGTSYSNSVAQNIPYASMGKISFPL